jgi:major outer membrane protein
MKKLCFLLLSVVSIGAVQALPVANPIDASLYKNGIWCCEDECSSCDPCDPCFSWCDAFSMRVGFWGDYVFNRYMERKNPGANNQGSVEDFAIYKNMGVITFNWCDWIDVYGLVGAASLQIQTPQVGVDSLNHELVTYNFTDTVSYGGGARMTLWECGGFGLGIEGQYFGFQPDVDNFVAFANRTVNYPVNNRGANYNEWQVGLGAAYQVHAHAVDFVPYAAIKFAGSNFKADNTVLTNDDGDTVVLPEYENAKTVGYAIGATVTFCEKGGLTVEGRFADEMAVHVNGQIRF